MSEGEEPDGGRAGTAEESGNVYECIFRAIDDAVFLVDVDRSDGEYAFTFRRNNESHRQQTGLSEAELRGQTPRALLGDEQGARVVENYRRCVEQKEPITYEETLELPVGTTHWQTKLTPIVEGDTVTQIVGTARNVTERKQRELELEYYEAIINHFTDVATVIDSSGTITYVSPSVRRVLGYEPEELVGEDGFQFQPPETAEAVEDAIQFVIENPDASRTVQTRFRRADGGWCWIESTIQNRLENDVIEGLLVSSREITRRKEYEQRLEEQRDNLDTLNRVLRHDIRNDLQLVTAYAEMLIEDDETLNEEDEKRRRYAESVLDGANHAVELTKTAGEMADVMLASDETRQAVDLRTTLEKELDDVRSAYSAAVVTAETVPAVSVLADEMLGSVFRNLLKNAVQHNDKELPEVRVSASEHGETVTVRIADNGPGIPEERRESIFGKGETGLGSEGTGLGLYLVESLVDGYGGDVWIEDNDPEGAVFVVELRTGDAEV
jgi:PAS domain S-box-containing protein